MDKFKEWPIRKHLRLEQYDYSQDGHYFITICTEGKKHLFGTIKNDEMAQSPAGKMLEIWVSQLVRKFPHVEINKYVIMPNHIHLLVCLQKTQMCTDEKVDIPCCMQWFKTMTTNAYIQGVKSGAYPPFDKRIWQRNYYEHVIRNDKDYNRVWTYIDENILQWVLDEYY